MTCTVCKSAPALIHIKGMGEFCRNCFRKRMAARSGPDAEEYDYPENAAFTDKDGSLHRFCLDHMFIGSRVRWDAVETGGAYEIGMYAHRDDTPADQIGRFFGKILDTLWNRTLEQTEQIEQAEQTEKITSPAKPAQPAPEALPGETSANAAGGVSGRAAKYFLANHGNIDIHHDAEGKQAVYFVIDGKPVSLEELGEMLSIYEGWTLQYQIRERGDDRVREDEILIPVEITKKALIRELNRAIKTYNSAGQHEKNAYIPFGKVPDLELDIERVIQKLAYMCSSRSIEEAVDTGEEMISILRNVESEEEWFPETMIELIEKTIYLF